MCMRLCWKRHPKCPLHKIRNDSREKAARKWHWGSQRNWQYQQSHEYLPDSGHTKHSNGERIKLMSNKFVEQTIRVGVAHRAISLAQPSPASIQPMHNPLAINRSTPYLMQRVIRWLEQKKRSGHIVKTRYIQIVVIVLRSGEAIQVDRSMVIIRRHACSA